MMRRVSVSVALALALVLAAAPSAKADHVFFAKPLPPAFNELPYPEEPDGFSWRAPAPR